jgi:cob(I)alamin adenosyltransferase
VTIATKRGDRGTTGLLYGGRVRKDSLRIECNGAVDEAQAALGMARASIAAGGAGGASGYGGAELDGLLVGIERDLWVLMAEVATSPGKRSRLVPGATLVTREMVEHLDGHVVALEAAGAMPKEFVVPGQSPASAAVDLARTVVRRAERRAVQVDLPSDSFVVPYLNRLSDLCWLVARVLEQEHLTARRPTPTTNRSSRTSRTPATSRAPRTKRDPRADRASRPKGS